MKFIIFILYVVIQGIKIKIDREVYVDDSKDVTLKSLFANDNKRDKNIHLIYSDTDSWKIYHDFGDIDLVKKLVDEYTLKLHEI